MLRTILLTLSLISVSFSGPKKVEGNGKTTTKQQSLKSFTRIKTTGIGHLVVSNGKTHELNIKAESNIFPHLQVKVQDDTLHLSISELVSLQPTQPITYYVSAPDLDYIRVEGATNVTFIKNTSFHKLELRADGSHLIKAKRIKVKDLLIDAFGSITFDLTGEVDTLKLNSQGANFFYGKNLQTTESYIESQGVDTIDLNVERFLKVRTLGVSTVTYKGKPKVKKWMSFTSTLRQVK